MQRPPSDARIRLSARSHSHFDSGDRGP